MDYMFAAAVLAIAFVSAYFYDHKDAKYARGKSQQIKSPRSFRYVYRWLQISTIAFGVCSYLFDHPYLLEIHQSEALRFAGFAVAVLGFAVFLIAKIHLKDGYSPCFDSYVPHEIVDRGIYRHVRHPIYTGNILLLSGLFVSTGSLLILANTIVLCMYYAISSNYEEDCLSRQFKAYRSYMNRTGKFFPRFG